MVSLELQLSSTQSKVLENRLEQGADAIRHLTPIRSLRRLGKIGAASICRLATVLHFANKLGPGVGQDEVLDVVLGIVKDVAVKAKGDGAGVLFRVNACRRRRAVGVIHVKGSSRVDAGLSANGTGSQLEHALELLELGRGQIEGELGVVHADEVDVDLQSAAEGLNACRAGAVGRLPARDKVEEGNVLSGEIVEGREFKERPGVLVKDVLEGFHGDESVAAFRVKGLQALVLFSQGDGQGLPVSNGRAQGRGLRCRLPLGVALESAAADGLEADDLEDGDKDGEDFKHHNGDMNPFTGRKVGVDLGLEDGSIHGDQEHGSSVEAKLLVKRPLGGSGKIRTWQCSKQWFGSSSPWCHE